MRDEVGGVYSVPALTLVKGATRLLLDPNGFGFPGAEAGVDLYLHQQALDTSTPSGRAMFQMLGVFAEFERSMIVARVHAGLKRARKEGKRLGRPR